MAMDTTPVIFCVGLSLLNVIMYALLVIINFSSDLVLFRNIPQNFRANKTYFVSFG